MFTPDGDKPLILIADDEPANVHVIVETLRQDYRIKVATNGKMALDIASRPEYPDLVILDVMMPDMDGFEVCKILKEQPQTRNIPVIFVTARSTPSREFEGLQLEAIDYIHKPVNPALLNMRVRNLVKLKKLQDSLMQASMIDGLTGIPNRRRFDDFLAHRWRVCLRNRCSLSVIMIDVNAFKLFNDSFGHLAGDDCLKEVSKAISSCIDPARDLAARYGGDEFAVVLGQSTPERASEVALSMDLAVSSLHIHFPQTPVGNLRISIGAATTTPSPAGHMLDLVRQADERLYTAKLRSAGT